MWTQIALLTCSLLVVSNGAEAMFGGLNIVGAFISKSKFCDYQCRMNEDSVMCGPECDVGQSRAAAEAFIDDEFGIVCINQNCTIFMGKKAINATLNNEEMGEVHDIFIFYNNRSINEFRKGVNDAFEKFQNLKQRVIPTTFAPLTNSATTVVSGVAQNKDTTTEKINSQLEAKDEKGAKDEKSKSKQSEKEKNLSGPKSDVKGGNSPPLNEGIKTKTAISGNDKVLNKNSGNGQDNVNSKNTTQMNDEKEAKDEKSKPSGKEKNKSGPKSDVKGGNSPPLNEGIKTKTAISGNDKVLNKNSGNGQDNVNSKNTTQMNDEKEAKDEKSKPSGKEKNKSGPKSDVKGGNSPPLNEGIKTKTAISGNDKVLNKNSGNGQDNVNSKNTTQMDDEKGAKAEKSKSKPLEKEKNESGPKSDVKGGNSPALNEGIKTKTAISGNDKVVNKNSGSGQDNVNSKNTTPMDDEKKNLSTINDKANMKLKIDKIKPKSGIIDEKENKKNETLSQKNGNSVDSRNSGNALNNQNLNSMKLSEGGNEVPTGIAGLNNIEQALNNQNSNNKATGEGSNVGQVGMMDLNNIINKTINTQNNANGSVSSVVVSKNTNGVKSVSNVVMYGNKTLHNTSKTEMVEDGNENNGTAINKMIDDDKMLNNQIGNDGAHQNRTIVGITTITTTSHIIMYGNETLQNKTDTIIEDGKPKGVNQHEENKDAGNKEGINDLKNVAGNEKEVTLPDNREKNDVRHQNQTNVDINQIKTTNKENINGGLSKDRSGNDLKNVAGKENEPALPKEMDNENKNQGEKLNPNNEAYKGTNVKNMKNKNVGNIEGNNKNQGEKLNPNNKAVDKSKGTNTNNADKNNLKSVTGNGIGTTVPNKMNGENKYQDEKLKLNNKSPDKQKEKPAGIEGENGDKPNANLNKDIKITINKSGDGTEKQNKESESLENNFGEDNYQDGTAKNAKLQVTPKNKIRMVRSGLVDKVGDKAKLNNSVKNRLQNKNKREHTIESVKKSNYKKRNFFLSKIYEILY